MNKKKVNLYYVRTFISLIILIAFLRKKNNKNNDRLLIVNRQFFSRKVINKCKNFLKIYFSSIEFINYKRGTLNSKNYLSYHFKRSAEVKKLSILIKKIISKYTIKKIYSGGDDIEYAVFKLTKKRKPTFYIEHGHGNLIASIISQKKINYKSYIYNIFIKILFSAKILYYGPIKWEGYITLFGNRFRNSFLKKNLIVDRSYLGFSPLVKKIIVSKESVNIIIDQLISCLKLKKNLKKNFILLAVGNTSLHQDPKQSKILISKILKLINKKKDIVLIKNKKKINKKGTWVNKGNFQKALLKKIKKQKIKFKIIDSFPLNELPFEVMPKLFKAKIIISEFSSVPFFSEILFNKVSIYVYDKYHSSNENHSDVDLVKNIINLYKKGFKKINFF